MAKQKYCETLTPGFYIIEETFSNRCFYITGTTKGNKWINLSVPNPQWTGLMCNGIDEYSIGLSTIHSTNPTNFVL
jgi:hypothetical protein